MKKLLKKFTALTMALSMLLVLTACDGMKKSDPMDEIPESSGGKDVVRAKAADNVFSLNINKKYSLNPLIATDHSNQLIGALVYENMLELDNNFNVIENLPGDHNGIISTSKVSEDGKTWTFEVEEGHLFHDGSPVTGKDLSYTMNRAINCDRYKGRFSSVQGISYSDTTLVVSLGIADTQFYKLMNLPVMKAGSFNDKPPMGSGPYTFVRETVEPEETEDGKKAQPKADLSQLKASEYYPGYENLPVDTIYLKEYPEADKKIIAYEDSLIDVVVNDPSSYTSLGFASTNEVHKYATTNMHYVAFNEKSPLGSLNTFRVAMQYAFDRAYFVELLHQNGVASAIPMYPTCDIYPDSLNDEMQYNLEKCKAILENMGYRDYDDDGYLELLSGNGKDVEINFLVCSGSSAKGGVVNRFADDMKTVGIKVNVKELTWEKYLEALEKGEFDMYYGEVKLRNNFDLTELLQPRPQPKKKDEPLITTNINFTGSNDPAYLQLINDYLAAGDMFRADAYLKLCDYICRSTGSLITIGFEKHQLISHRGAVKGIDPNAGNPLYNFQNWEIMLD